MLQKEFWKNKKVLLTGHTGFKGSWMAMLLHELGAQVYGFSKDIPTDPSIFNLCQIGELISEDFRYDISEIDSFLEVYKKVSPQIVIHMAAQALVQESFLSPLETFKVNIMGTANVLEAIRISEHKPQATLIVTTDKCYSNKEWIWPYREDEALGGSDPYSASKAGAEVVVQAYKKSFFDQADIRVSTARSGNVIGGGDWSKDRIIPDIVRSLENKEIIQIRNPLAVRPWQHVIEPVCAYLLLVEKMSVDKSACGPFNFGPNPSSEKNVEFIVNEFLKHWGTGSWEPAKNSKPKEAQLLKLDINKAKTILKWEPRLSLDATLQWTSDWYKNYDLKNDLPHFMRGQIKTYLSL